MPFLFIGPDDKDTCDSGGPLDTGCDGAVNGNPYPDIDACPEPGEFDCQGNCRHMVQLDGDAADDIPTMDWHATLGFGVSGDAADNASLYYGGATHDIDGNEVPTGAGKEQPSFTDHEQAVMGMEPDAVADYLNANDLTLDDIAGVFTDDELALIRADMQAKGYIEPDVDSADTLPQRLAIGDIDGAASKIAAGGLDQALDMAQAGFPDDQSKAAYYLAEALNLATNDTYSVIFNGPTKMWYVRKK